MTKDAEHEGAPASAPLPQPSGAPVPPGEAYPVLASARYGLLFAILVLVAMLVAAILMSTRGGG